MSARSRRRGGLAPSLLACACAAFVAVAAAPAQSPVAEIPAAVESVASSARLVIEPRAAQVGEPVRGRIEIALPRACELAPPALEAWLGERAALLGAPSVSALPQPGASDLVLHAIDFEFTALEAGVLALPALELRWTLANAALEGSASSLELPAGELRIASALAPEETAPRALRSERIEAQQLPWWRTKVAASAISAAVATIVGVLVVGGGHAWVRRKQRLAQPAPPSALERLAALESANARWTAEHALATTQELARILRAGIDARRERAHPGASDEEWLALQPAAERERLAAHVARLASARFGGEAPSEWALRELFAETRALLTVAEAREAAVVGASEVRA